ncbi:class I SAM-dependent methyltransferase [Oligoflexia bacterium]|nr:class I SAM-dependent methyltransferase [Oligoflexia bacterium]
MLKNALGMKFVKPYLRSLNMSALGGSYDDAYHLLTDHVTENTSVLDLGCDDCNKFDMLNARVNLKKDRYIGFDYGTERIQEGKQKEFELYRVDFSYDSFPIESETIDLAFCFQTIEHVLNPIFFLKNVFQSLKPGGYFIVTTPNMSAWFNIFHLVLGLPPSSGPHVDSEKLKRKLALYSHVWSATQSVETEETRFRHLHVHTFRGLKMILRFIGFDVLQSKAFGYYPLPIFLSKFACKIDPWHAHHMLFFCQKPFDAIGAVQDDLTDN